MKLITCLVGLFLITCAQAQLIDIPADSEVIKHNKRYSKRLVHQPLDDLLDLREMSQILLSDLKTQNLELKKIKYFILNGQVELARALIKKLTYNDSPLKPVIYRYLAILAFLEKEFTLADEYLAINELQVIPNFGKVCLLKVLVKIALSKTDDLDSTWERCKVDNANKLQMGHLQWADTLVSLKLRRKNALKQISFNDLRFSNYSLDQTKTFLKLALYLNQGDLIEEQLSTLTFPQVQDKEIREIIGTILFNSKSYVKANKFIEDLQSPNSENIRGNFYLLDEKYELAFEKFNLALKQKKNSQNALKRLILLAWILERWPEGHYYANQLLFSSEHQIATYLFRATFFTQMEQYEQAKLDLDYIRYNWKKGEQLEVSQLASFVALKQAHIKELKKNALISCQQYDLINCWILNQLSLWDAFPYTLKRKDSIPHKETWKILTQEKFNLPLKEEIYVNQEDIEEMDDKLITLISD